MSCVVIFGDLFSFPDGGAATNRVYTYAKGFVENGLKVHVVCFLPTSANQNEGTIEGIKYHLPLNNQKRSKYFIVRRWHNLAKFWKTFLTIKRIAKKDKIVAINSWSNFLLTHLFGSFLSRYCNAKYLVECSEHPFRYFEGSAIKKIQGQLKFAIETHISDGILCISHFLINFYKKQGVSEKKLFLIPSTVDTQRFNQPYPNPVDYRYVGYFGGLTFDRDNIGLLIDSFAKFSGNNPDARLILGGFGTDEERAQILKQVNGYNLSPKVVLLDFLSREEILTYIVNAHVLVMVRSDNFYTKVSYPSKLTEFLATSKPVISVNIGEIPMYLKDGVEVFLVEPGNVEALAAKLDYVWNNYEAALQVGQKGKQLTETIFNYRYQAKRMMEFIDPNLVVPAKSTLKNNTEVLA